MEASADNKNKYIALGLTLVFHAFLFLLFVWIVFITPIPPFEIKPVPEIEIGLGMEGMGSKDAGGSGRKDKDIATSPPEKTVAKAEPKVTEAPAKILTDDTEESVAIKSSPKKVTKKQVITETPKVVEEKPSSELSDALAILKNKKKHTGSGEGTGNTGGSGNGTKLGVGDGSGTGHGNGTPGYNGAGGGYDLKGRSLVRKPARMTDSEEEGIVVVEIIVDETGKVIKATPGQRGSTTTSSNLYAKARQAAYEARFNASAQGVKEQRGSYTFVFTLE